MQENPERQYRLRTGFLVDKEELASLKATGSVTIKKILAWPTEVGNLVELQDGEGEKIGVRIESIESDPDQNGGSIVTLRLLD